MEPDIFEKCPLFAGLGEKERAETLDFFHAVRKFYKRGEILHHPGEPVMRFGLLLSGNIHVSMDDFDGNRMLMANVTPGNTFAESLCYLGKETQIMITSVRDSEVLLMDTESLKNPSLQPSASQVMIAQRFISMLAQRTLALNDRIQTLSKLSIRQKVITLLSQHMNEGSSVVYLPFDREAMAVYLGVNQSALSRELGSMQKEGIIRFKNNRFEVL